MVAIAPNPDASQSVKTIRENLLTPAFTQQILNTQQNLT